MAESQEQAGADLARRFAAFWAAYPRKVGKVAAWFVWKKLAPDQALLEQMLTALAWQVKSRQWLEGFVPHPRTWLFQQRWDDEPFEPQALAVVRAPQTRGQRISAANRETLAQVLGKMRGSE